MARNPELEAALVANPDDRDTYVVYADWLEAQGEPRAELMHLQLREELEPVRWQRRLLRLVRARLEPILLGDLANRVTELDWRRGLIRAAKLSPAVEPLVPLVRELLAHPCCVVLDALVISGSSKGLGDLSQLTDTIARTASPTLRALALVLPRDPPGLDALADLPRLELLTIESAVTPSMLLPESARTIGTLAWPRLRELSLDLGRTGASALDLAPLFDRTDLTSLSLVGARDAAFCSELCRLLVTSPLAANIERLTLWCGRLAAADYELLLAHRARFVRLKQFGAMDRAYSDRISAGKDGT